MLAAASGVLFALSSPPTDLLPLVLVGLAGLSSSIATAPTARRAAGFGLLWATVAGIVGMRFVPEVVDHFTSLGRAGGALALLLLSAFQGLAWAAGAAVSHMLAKKVGLHEAPAFGAGALVAISAPAVFAWSPAALLSPWPVFLQLADIIGERGVSFLLAVVSALFAEGIVRRPSVARRLLGPAIGAGVLGCLALHGALRMRAVDRMLGERVTLTVGVVQAAVPAKLRWEPRARAQILTWLRELTAEAERAGAELTIWPEAAYPYVLEHDSPRAPTGRERIVGGGVRGPVLFGLATRRPGGDGQHNSATIVGADREVQAPQAKLELLWFGETIPFSDFFPALRRVFFRTGGMVPGDRVALLEHGDARIGVLNCYEDTLPSVGRRIARAEPNLLVNVTNDAWFGPTAEPELHLRLSVLRSIEARLDLVRAVNLGVPAWIDAAGRVRQRGSDSVRGVMLARPALATKNTSPTLYVKAGDAPLWLGLSLAAAIAWRRRRVPRKDATEPNP